MQLKLMQAIASTITGEVQDFNCAMTAAWIECQKEFENPKRTAPANWGKYAPLSEILDTFVPILNKHGFSFRHDCQQGEIIAIVTFKDGGTITASCPIKGKIESMTDVGACITYGRRYTCGMIFGVEGERDLDNGSGSKAEKDAYNANAISEAQAKRFWMNAKRPGITNPMIEHHMQNKFGIKTTAEIPRGRYNEIHDYFHSLDWSKLNEKNA